MKIKVYQAINAVDLGLKVKTDDGRKVYCHFTNGRTYPTLEGGKFRTSDPQVQRALETNPAYRRMYVIEGETFIPEAESILPGMFPAGDVGVTDELVYGVKNAGEARVWLKENKKATLNDIRNVDAIDEFCAKVKVVFPDWMTNREFTKK